MSDHKFIKVINHRGHEHILSAEFEKRARINAAVDKKITGFETTIEKCDEDGNIIRTEAETKAKLAIIELKEKQAAKEKAELLASLEEKPKKSKEKEEAK